MVMGENASRLLLEVEKALVAQLLAYERDD
jgi:hypothetical protein